MVVPQNIVMDLNNVMLCPLDPKVWVLSVCRVSNYATFTPALMITLNIIFSVTMVFDVTMVTF